jgi:hypothetical protein
MKVLVVDESGELEAVVGALEANGLKTCRPPQTLAGAGSGEVGEIAAALISFEGLLAEQGPNAVLLGSASNLALAAVLVATKAGIPVAAVGDRSGMRGPAVNVRLIAQLADAGLAADAAATAAWVRELGGP